MSAMPAAETMLPELTIADRTGHARNWLKSSGIQRDSGGVARHYDWTLGRYQKLSTKATSDYIRALIASQEGEQKKNPPIEAVEAGLFLLNNAYSSEAEMFAMEVEEAGQPATPLASFFESGATIRALLDLWKGTYDQRFLDAADACATALTSRLPTVDGSFFPLYDLSQSDPFSGSGHWSQESDIHQLKVALAFQALVEEKGGGEFEQRAETLLDWSLERQETFLPGESPEPVDVMDRMHAYCCFLEGLLPVAGLNGDAARTLQFGLLRIENLVRDLRDQYVRCDVVSQCLRLRLYADKLGIMELDYVSAEEEADLVSSFQMQTGEAKTDGAFAFAKKRRRWVVQLDPSTTIYALQALEMWQQAQEGGLREPWQTLI